ncbi:hypothetical protein ACSBR1_018603 [Camellia fascicularis]
MLKKSVAAAAPMELLKQNMAAVASSSVSFFGIRDEDQIQMKQLQLQQQQQQQQQHFSIPTSSTTPPTTAPQKKRRNFPGTPRLSVTATN